jgi:hypothetical protein
VTEALVAGALAGYGTAVPMDANGVLIVTPRQRLLTTYEPGTCTVVVRGVLWEVDQRSVAGRPRRVSGRLHTNRPSRLGMTVGELIKKLS